MTIEEWAKDFKSYINELDMPKDDYKGIMEYIDDAVALLKEQEDVVHPEPSCEMTYITDCCCDLCGVQLIREDNFCRCCGKPIDWSK